MPHVCVAYTPPICFGLSLKCSPTGSHICILDLQLMGIFWEAEDSLGLQAAEVGHQGRIVEGFTHLL